MRECICSSCRNLKGIVDEENNELNYECIYGFPSEDCEECTSGECDQNCEHYLIDNEEEEYIIVKCQKCGKELKKGFKDGPEGDVLCVDCYLSN